MRGLDGGGAKDVLFAHLTGELLTDPSTAAGTAVYDLDGRQVGPELVAATQLPRLPTLAPASTSGRCSRSWGERLGLPRGSPVVLGAADSVLGALGVGATRHGDVAVIAGTSAIVVGITDASIRDGPAPLSGHAADRESGGASKWMCLQSVPRSMASRACLVCQTAPSRVGGGGAPRRRAACFCRIWRRANRVRCGIRI